MLCAKNRRRRRDSKLRATGKGDEEASNSPRGRTWRNRSFKDMRVTRARNTHNGGVGNRAPE
eukprot:3357691-Prymnesium_polylepis.1